jgi:alpha-L-arabinofuranosidase
MYKVHQDAVMVLLQFQLPQYVYNGQSINAVNASIDKDDKSYVPLCNLDPNSAHPIFCNLNSYKASASRGEIITSKK